MASSPLDGNHMAAIAGAVAALVFVGAVAAFFTLTGGDDSVVAVDATSTSSTVSPDDEPTVDTTSTSTSTTAPTTTSTTASPTSGTEAVGGAPDIAEGEPASLPTFLDGLTVRVDEEVKFAAGGTSATLDGAVVLGERDVYRLGAREGQTMELTITSLEENAVFDLLAPDGSIIETEVMASESDLPASGDYFVVVGGTRGNATYELTISIPA